MLADSFFFCFCFLFFLSLEIPFLRCGSTSDEVMDAKQREPHDDETSGVTRMRTHCSRITTDGIDHKQDRAYVCGCRALSALPETARPWPRFGLQGRTGTGAAAQGWLTGWLFVCLFVVHRGRREM